MPFSDQPLVFKGTFDCKNVNFKLAEKSTGGNIAYGVKKLEDKEFYKSGDLASLFPGFDVSRFGDRFEKEEFSGAPGSIIVAHAQGTFKNTVIVYGATEECAPHRVDTEAACAALSKFCKTSKIEELSVVGPYSSRASVADFVTSFLATSFAEDRFREKKDEPLALKTLTIVTPIKDDDVISEGKHLGVSVVQAKELVNAPCNFVNPPSFAAECKAFAKEHNLEAKVFGFDECQAMGMGSFCAVAQGMKGSAKDSQFVHITYKNGTPKKRFALVGKGVMHDTGGYNIKSLASGIHNMHTDMGGAAAQFTTFKYLVNTCVKDVELHLVIPMVENHVDANAVLPGSIVRAMDGTTIDIINTDAEGRLILCDAIVYSQKVFTDNPLPGVEEHIYTAATLTGAQIVSLGLEIAAFYSTDEKLAENINAASVANVDNCWRMPLPKKYAKYVKGNLSDITNLPGAGQPGAAGSVMAAMFLKHFIKKEGVKYAHFDMAGPVFVERKATGFGPRLFNDVVHNVLKSADVKSL